MVANPPQLWLWMTTHWCRLPQSMAWLWWRALCKAQWSAAAQWRETFLNFERPDRVLSRDLIEGFLQEIARPKHLMDLLEALMEEGKLLRRDAHHLQELVLTQTDRDGQWKHQQHRKGGTGGRTDLGRGPAPPDARRVARPDAGEASRV